MEWYNDPVYIFMLQYLFNAAVQALPDPEELTGPAYRFLYKFLHLVAANWKLVSKQNKEDKAEGMTLFVKKDGTPRV